MSPRISISERLLEAFEVILRSVWQNRSDEGLVSEARWETLGLFVP